MAAARARTAPRWCTIVVGEAPSRISDPHQPLLGGRSGLFLARLAALEPYRFAFLFRLLNLLPVMPDRHAKAARIRAAGARLLPDLRGRRVLALGRPVAAALGADGPFLEWAAPLCDVDLMPVPHPSSRSRLWTPALVERVAALLRAEAARAAGEAILDGARLPWLEKLAETPAAVNLA